MKAITILQPWASLIACGAKKIETRSWATKYRGPIAIHAGISQKYYALQQEEPFASALEQFSKVVDIGGAVEAEYEDRIELEYGKVIAIAELVDIWEMSHKHIPLKHPMEYYDQPNLTYVTTIYADKEKTMPIREEAFTIPAQKFTRPRGGEFKETWLCENDKGEFKDIGGDELVFGHFEKGRYAWELANVRQIKPVPAKGMQRIWEWDHA